MSLSAAFRLTRAAEEDLLGIGRYTLGRWGEAQCGRYLTELDARFHALAKRPEAGRTCDEIRAGYRCYREGKHVIFYRLERTRSILIVRILHERMLPELHL